MVTENNTIASGVVSSLGIHLRSNIGRAIDKTDKALQKKNKNSVEKKSLRKRSSNKKSDSNADDIIKPEDDIQPITHDDFKETEEQEETNDIVVRQKDCGWSSVEKGLYAKGVEIFGRNK